MRNTLMDIQVFENLFQTEQYLDKMAVGRKCSCVITQYLTRAKILIGSQSIHGLGFGDSL